MCGDVITTKCDLQYALPGKQLQDHDVDILVKNQYLDSQPVPEICAFLFLFNIDVQDEGIRLELSKAMDYDKMEAAVATALRERGQSVPQDKYLRFTAQQASKLVCTLLWSPCLYEILLRDTQSEAVSLLWRWSLVGSFAWAGCHNIGLLEGVLLDICRHGRT